LVEGTSETDLKIVKAKIENKVIIDRNWQEQWEDVLHPNAA
jgi:hypothetical protein